MVLFGFYGKFTTENHIMTREKLIRLLEKHHAYRADAYVDELMKRIERKEIKVEERPEFNGELVIMRRVAIVQVTFKWPKSGFVSRLVEEKRTTGKKEVVCSQKDGISYKIRTDEKPLCSAKRVMSKKLRKRGIVPVDTGMIDHVRTVDSRFGFLPTVIVRFFFKAEMPEEKFEPRGFAKDRVSPSGALKHSFFGWIPDPLWT